MMSKLGAQKFISFLVYSEVYVGVTYYGCIRKIYFNNDVY